MMETHDRNSPTGIILPSSVNISSSSSQSLTETIENSNVITSSENMNNENREIELQKSGEKTSIKLESDLGNSDSDDRNNGNFLSENTTNENVENKAKKINENVSKNAEENKPNKNETEQYSEEYSKHITYDDKGSALYTDPTTKQKYEWSDDNNQWLPITTGKIVETQTGDNPYENEHYRWCSDTNQWIIKENSETENEYYKWCNDTKQWIPKINSNDVKYSFVDDLHHYTDKDGAVFFWDAEKNAWFPKIDDDFMAIYQMNYGFVDNTTPTNENEEKEDSSKIKEDATKIKQTSTAGGKRKVPPETPKWFDLPAEQNTKVYVSNLPLDITEDEYVELMSKCGLIMRDVHTQKFKIKLYTEPDGSLKGDGLCDYIKVESVELALNILDGSEIRGKKIRVQRAKFQMRGEYNPALKPKMRKKDKEKAKKMKEKLFDWRPDKMRGERGKHEKVVIVKNLFTPELFDKEVHLIMDYQNDLREECGKCGTVRKVVIYDRHPEGVAQITMSDPDEADLVVKLLHNRFFGKRQLTAEIWDGKTKFKISETETETNKRLNQWEKYLEDASEKREQLEDNTVPESNSNNENKSVES